ncbi:hypothetical protein RHMOL_Rhmol05G0154700 [Rhododendron molle]|uniref:Uncharacterized protein n=1 Tax=Rhododendron molle TaxID=49168 RepID=A0ACC0NRL4_RHOML|nr:hypothetical protein RHMOL_Rhmol05G0154700 [Rhododendron molle]
MEPFNINPGIQRNTKETQSLNPLFEPTLEGWEDLTKLDQGYKPNKRGNNPHNPSQRMLTPPIYGENLRKEAPWNAQANIPTGGIQ